MGKIYFKKEEVEVGLELTAEEMVSCFEFIGSCFTTDHVDLLMKRLSELTGEPVDEEKMKEANKAADDLIKAMEKEEDVYECKTSQIWENKYALVKAWLVDHNVKFEDKINGACRREVHYDLTMSQLAEMIDWLDEHGDEKFDTTIQI